MPIDMGLQGLGQLLLIAGQALYKAKSLGCNRVEAAEAETALAV